MTETDRFTGLILGGGGHARVIIDILNLTDDPARWAVLDPDESRWGTDLDGRPIIGGDDKLAELVSAGATDFVIGLAGVGDNRPRRRLFNLALEAGLRPISIIHPRAIVSGRAGLADGVQIFPGAIVNAGAELGPGVIVNSGAIVEHDCRVGPFVHLATGARISGGVRVDELAHLGAGSIVRQGLTIGRAALIGAGAVVVKDVPAGLTVVGIPAAKLR